MELIQGIIDYSFADNAVRTPIDRAIAEGVLMKR